MKPFCGYNMGDYFQHWFEMGDRLGAKAPRIFYVNWFRKGDNGRWLWPGFGENCRVLKWMCERFDGKVGAAETPIGLMPKIEDLDLSGLFVDHQDMEELLRVDPHDWKAEYFDIETFFDQFGSRLPDRLKAQLGEFKKRLCRF
jgi:phosphoenolpyruvate carboxykinase (GTP)